MQKSIQHLFQHSLIISRLRTTSGHKKQFQSTATIDGMLQEKYHEANSRLGILESRSFICYVDIEENVQEGDRVAHRDKIYQVKEVTRKDYGINTHLQLILEEANE